MRKRSIIISIICCILFISILSGCSNSTPKSLSGRYEREGNADFSYIEFFSDGKYTSSKSNYEGDYSIDGNRLRLEGILVSSRTYYFKVSGDILMLSSDETFEYFDTYKKV